MDIICTAITFIAIIVAMVCYQKYMNEKWFSIFYKKQSEETIKNFLEMARQRDELEIKLNEERTTKK